MTTSFGFIKGKDARPIVKEVFEFAMTKLVKDDKELYCPEPILKNQPNNIANYPRNIPYANMDGVYDLPLKERLLERWKF
jgi:iron(III) transport system substrate-binding protein